MSFLKEFITWAFVPSPQNKKHLTLPHSIFALILTVASTIYLSDTLSSLFETYFPSTNEQDQHVYSFPAWGRSFAVPFLTAYLFIMALTRFSQNGSMALYEMIWACNQAIIMMISGILRGNALTVGASMVMISIDQCLWYIDILGFILIRKFPVGVAKYITWPTTTKIRLLTSTHHLWFIPMLMALLVNTPQLTHSAYFMSFIMTLFQSVLGRVLAPRYIKQKGKEDVYMNINLSYELWKDVKIDFLSRYDHAPAYKAVPFGNLMWNIGNYIFFIILRFILNSLR